jgi:hypothetical protein
MPTAANLIHHLMKNRSIEFLLYIWNDISVSKSEAHDPHLFTVALFSVNARPDIIPSGCIYI